MKVRFAALPLLVILALTLASVAVAKGLKDSETITISEKGVMVAGTELKPGDYHVTWEGTGSVVQVSFKRGDKVLVTTSARLVNESSPYDGALQMKSMDNNTKVLEGIQWKKKSLVFDQSSSGS
jgi:hypothetical protein